MSANQLRRIVRDVHLDFKQWLILIADDRGTPAFEAFVEFNTKTLRARQSLRRAWYGSIIKGTRFPRGIIRRCSGLCPSLELVDEDPVSVGDVLLRNS